MFLTCLKALTKNENNFEIYACTLQVPQIPKDSNGARFITLLITFTDLFEQE